MHPRLKKLSNKRLFCYYIGTTLDEAESIIANIDSHYTERMVGKKGKQRLAQCPSLRLKFLHRQIKKLFDEFPSPDYLHSGVKGRSYITNAEAHAVYRSCKKMDIKGFYKNTKKEYLFRFLHYALEIPDDVAWFIIDLVTYRGIVPTGSPISQQIAFWSHFNLFEEIYELARKNGAKNTVYVDDLTFTSNESIDPTIHLKVNKVLSRHELKLKRSKIEGVTNVQTEITGVVRNPEGVSATPSRQKKLLFKSLKSVEGNVHLLEEKEFRKLIGVIRCIRSVEKNVFPKLYSQFLVREKELNRRRAQSKKDRKRISSLCHRIGA